MMDAADSRSGCPCPWRSCSVPPVWWCNHGLDLGAHVSLLGAGRHPAARDHVDCTIEKLAEPGLIHRSPTNRSWHEERAAALVDVDVYLTSCNLERNQSLLGAVEARAMVDHYLEDGKQQPVVLGIAPRLDLDDDIAFVADRRQEIEPLTIDRHQRAAAAAEDGLGHDSTPSALMPTSSSGGRGNGSVRWRHRCRQLLTLLT